MANKNGDDYDSVEWAAEEDFRAKVRKGIAVAVGMPEDLIFQRQYLGQLSPPLRLGGFEIRVREKYHPECKEKLRPGEWIYGMDEERPNPYVVMSLETYKYLAKFIWRLDRRESVRRWEDMPNHMFHAYMETARRNMEHHFEEKFRLKHILEAMKSDLLKRMHQPATDQLLDEVHRIVCQANSSIAHIIAPRMWMQPISFRVVEIKNDLGQVDGVDLQPVGTGFPHEEFMREFGDVVERFALEWSGRQQHPDDEPRIYELRGHDEPFPPDP